MRTRRSEFPESQVICFQIGYGNSNWEMNFEFQDDLGCASPRFNTAILIFRGCPVLDTSPHDLGLLSGACKRDRFQSFR